MEKIASFTVDHTKFGPGMYISRVDGDIVTYDVRMKKPNGGDYLDVAGAHTIEHLFATYARNTEWKDHVIYVGPMGCRTGFYFLAKDLPAETAIRLVYDAMCFIRDFEGDIPGATEVECGNYREQNLDAAKKDIAVILELLKDYPAEKLSYPC